MKRRIKMDENSANDLQLGELIPHSFDYNLSLEELDKWLTEQYEQLSQKKIPSLAGDCAMLGAALDLIDFAKNNLDISLDFSEKSLDGLRIIISMMRESYVEEKPSDEIFATWVNMTSGLFGCIIIKNLGGNWVESNAGMSVVVNGTAAFITNQVLGLISGENNNENAVIEIYDYLKKQSGNADAE